MFRLLLSSYWKCCFLSLWEPQPECFRWKHLSDPHYLLVPAVCKNKVENWGKTPGRSPLAPTFAPLYSLSNPKSSKTKFLQLRQEPPLLYICAELIWILCFFPLKFQPLPIWCPPGAVVNSHTSSLVNKPNCLLEISTSYAAISPMHHTYNQTHQSLPQTGFFPGSPISVCWHHSPRRPGFDPLPAPPLWRHSPSSFASVPQVLKFFHCSTGPICVLYHPVFPPFLCPGYHTDSLTDLTSLNLRDNALKRSRNFSSFCSW